MKHKLLYLRNVMFLLLIIAFFSSMLTAQKKPLTVNLDANNDDDNLCGFQSENNKYDGTGILSNTQFCRLYKVYSENKDGNEDGKRKARSARNEMILLVVGQIDSFYKFRKDGRSTKIRIFQTILDFLRIGGDLAVTIMNGERAKTIIGAALAGTETGATKFNKNFQILQTQVLINKMNTKRTQILTKLLLRRKDSVDDYPWYEAKIHLRDYLLAGTFDDALDTLVAESGAEFDKAKVELDKVTEKKVDDAICANNTLADLDAALKSSDPVVVARATDTLRTVVKNLMANQDIAAKLSAKNITVSSTGREIWNALFIIRGDFGAANRIDLADEIDRAIAQNCKK